SGSPTVLPSARSSLRLGAPVLCAALGVLALFTGPDRPAGGTTSPAPPPERSLYDEAVRLLDARKGLGLALRDQKKYAEAAQAFRDALRQEPGDSESTGLLERVLAAGGASPESRPRGASNETPMTVVARARDARFFVRESGRFRPLFVKGVN